MNIAKLFIAVFCMSLLFVQCKDDSDSTTYSTITGKVSLDANTVADGAIISLSTEPNGANVVSRTVADAEGNYSIMGVANGTYYLNATFEAMNNNNLKSAGAVILTGVEVEVAVSGNTTQDIAMAGMLSSGTTNFKLAEWSWDNTHSTFEFEFPYDVVNAVFTGHFSTAGFDALEFDEANPSATKIRVWVDIRSSETGAPGGRDGINGCMVGYFGVEKDPADTVTVYTPDGEMVTNWPNEETSPYTADLWGDASATTYEKQSSVVGASGVALFEATEVLAYGNGYKAKGDFTFAGATESVDMYFTYLEGYDAENRSGDLTEYVSFYGTLKFNPLGQFGVSSGHLGDADVTVKVSAQFNRAAL